MPTQNEKENVYSQMLRAGKKTYFFDVKKTSKGDNYLTVAESYTDKEGKKIINRLLIFKDQFADFGNALLGLKEYFQ